MTKTQKIAIGAVLVVSAGALIYSLATYKGHSSTTSTDPTPVAEGQGTTLSEMVIREQTAHEGLAPVAGTQTPTVGVAPAGTTGGVPPIATATTPVTPGLAAGSTGVGNGAAATGGATTPAGTTAGTATVEPTVTTAAAPTTRTYTVKKGDTLQSIASRELGATGKWKDILAANPNLNPNKMKIGMTLTLPQSPAAGTAATTGGTTGATTGGTPTAASAPVSPTRATTAGRTGAQPAATTSSKVSTRGSVKIYTVQENDTLRKISKDVYGSDDMWQNVFKANRDVIGSDPGRLEPGTILILPTSGR